MTDQVDVGWASPPFGLKEIDEGKIRVVARATDATLVRGQTIRVLIANADTLAKKQGRARPLHAGLSRDHRLHVQQQSAGHQGLCGVRRAARAVAKRVRDEFFPKALLDPDEIKGLDSLMEEAVTLKFITAPLTKDQIAELIQIPPRKK